VTVHDRDPVAADGGGQVAGQFGELGQVPGKAGSERAHAQLKNWHILRKLRCCS
jgi:hypothetical protein